MPTSHAASRRFHASLGQTIHGAITQLRLEQVKRQLVETKVALKTEVLNQSIEVVRRRIDELGTLEPTIERQGEDRIVV